MSGPHSVMSLRPCKGSGSHKGAGNFAEFIGMQAVLLSPILFLLLLGGCVQWIKKRKDLPPPLFFCGFVTFTSLGVMALAACFQKVQGNWGVFIFPTAIIILGWDCFQEHLKRIRWAKIGLAFSILLTALFFILPSFTTVEFLSSYALPYRLNPFKHNMGWNDLQIALARNGYDPDQHFLASNKYQGASILSFYGEGQKRAYFLNLNQTRKNQFSYWPTIQEEQSGKTGYFVWIEKMADLQKYDLYQNKLEPYFESVEFLELAPLIHGAKGALIFRCKNCKNQQPSDPNLY